MLCEAEQVNQRERANSPWTVERPKGYKVEAPIKVWSWDITYLAGPTRGVFYRLYMLEDIFSRKIIGWKVHEEERAEHAGHLIQKSV